MVLQELTIIIKEKSMFNFVGGKVSSKVPFNLRLTFKGQYLIVIVDFQVPLQSTHAFFSLEFQKTISIFSRKLCKNEAL